MKLNTVILTGLLVGATALAQVVEPAKVLPTPPAKPNQSSGVAATFQPSAATPAGAHAIQVTPSKPATPQEIRPAGPEVQNLGTTPVVEAPATPTAWTTATSSTNTWSKPATSSWSSKPAAANPWETKPPAPPKSLWQ